MGIEAGAVAVVTGGASGLGRALGEQCAQHGMRVALLDRDGERVRNEAAALADASGTEVLGLGVDVSRADEVDDAAASVAERFGRADLVLSNVGVQLFGGIEQLTDDEWRWVLDVNVIGGVRVTRAFLPLLRAARGARIAFTSSSSVFAPAAQMAAYQASKFALWGVAESLRMELADDDISVSVVFPSGMITRHLESSEAAAPGGLDRHAGGPGELEAILASSPGLFRDVASGEQAAAAVFAGLVAGADYIVSHGDLVADVESRNAELLRAAEAVRDRPTPE